LTVKYNPAERDWSDKEYREYFSFNPTLTTMDRNAIYYGELITLYNPNIQRNTIEVIPEHSEEKPKEKTPAELKELKRLLIPDSTLMANPFLIKKVQPPE